MKGEVLMHDKLPLFMRREGVAPIIAEAIAAIPKGTNVYVTGGAARNAVYYNAFKKKLPQRDYDLLVVGDMQAYVRNLRKKGFIYGKIRRKHTIVVKKRRVPHPVDPLDDYVYLDLYVAPQFSSLQENIRFGANFTINQFAFPLAASTSPAWRKRIVTLPGAIRDMKAKQLRLSESLKHHPGDLFACLRFMSQGFKPPSKNEVGVLLEAFARFEPWRYPRNVKKVFRYVGGEEKARHLAKKLGITHDIFSYETVLEMRQLKRAENSSRNGRKGARR